MKVLSGAVTTALLLLSALPVAAQYGGWSQSRKIIINTSATGAGVTGDVKSFPLPIHLTGANFNFAAAKPDGSDLRFSSSAGAPLPYEIESWDAAGQKAAVWVKTDVKGGDAAQFINIHWGNASAASESDGKKVFGKVDGWLGAWHLAEKGSQTAGGYKDASDNGAHGKGVNIAGDATAPGRIGPAVNLSRAAKEYVLIEGSHTGPLFNPLPSKGTFSIWSNAKSHPAAYIAMFAKGETGFRIHYFGTGAQTEPCIDVSNYDFCPLPSGGYTRVENNQWYHFVFVIDRPKTWYYINGKLEVQKDDSNAWKTAGDEPVTIGNNEKTPGSNSRSRSFDGMLDEARILSEPRDAHWAKLDYESQKEGSKLLDFSSPMSLTPRSLAHVLPGAAATLRRFDLQGRLVAEVRSTGNRAADLSALRAASGPGVFVDRLISGAQVVTTGRQAMIH